MAKQSTITTHRRREEIERAMAEGVPLVEISRRFNVSPSAASRYKSNRMDVLSQVLDDSTPDPSDLFSRLADLVDSATKARKAADAIGSPATKARAQSNELAAIGVLVDRLGVTDLDALRLSESAGYLVRTIQRVVEGHPEILPDVLHALRAQNAELDDLADSMAELFKEKNR